MITDWKEVGPYFKKAEPQMHCKSFDLIPINIQTIWRKPKLNPLGLKQKKKPYFDHV